MFGVTLLVELRGADEPTVTDVLPLGAIVAAVPGEQRARVDELLATAL